MNADVLELVEIVQLEIGAFEALLETLTQEQVALVTQDLSGVEEAVTNQQTLVERARSLEAARINVVERLRTLDDRAPGTVTLKELIDRIENPQAGRVRSTPLPAKSILSTKDKFSL